jgi:hypothetical protein
MEMIRIPVHERFGGGHALYAVPEGMEPSDALGMLRLMKAVNPMDRVRVTRHGVSMDVRLVCLDLGRTVVP